MNKAFIIKVDDCKCIHLAKNISGKYTIGYNDYWKLNCLPHMNLGDKSFISDINSVFFYLNYRLLERHTQQCKLRVVEIDLINKKEI